MIWQVFQTHCPGKDIFRVAQCHVLIEASALLTIHTVMIPLFWHKFLIPLRLSLGKAKSRNSIAKVDEQLAQVFNTNLNFSASHAWQHSIFD